MPVAIETLERRQLLSASLAAIAQLNNSVDRLTQDSSGNLYAIESDTDNAGDGQVFRVNGKTGSVWALPSFNAPLNYYYYADSIIRDAAGDLFGVTAPTVGTNASNGTIFEIAAYTNKLTTVVTFSDADGAPNAELSIDAAGDLYGYFGVRDDTAKIHGNIFEVKAGTNQITTLASFDAAEHQLPEGPLLPDDAGNLYGTTLADNSSGPDNQYTVFRLNINTRKLTTLAKVDAPYGIIGGLIYDARGNLYGETFGNANPMFDLEPSTIFKIAAGTEKLSTLGVFQPDADLGAIIVDAAGNVFGTQIGSGLSGLGDGASIFRITAQTNRIATVRSFGGSNGIFPYGNLVADAAGSLYGSADGPNPTKTYIFKISGSGFVIPTVTVTAPSDQSANADVAKLFSLGSFTQAGATGPYNIEINWGDGSLTTKIFRLPSTGAIPPHGHRYRAAGTDTVMVTVTDSLGHTSSKAFKVVVAATVFAEVAVTMDAGAENSGAS